MIDLGKGVSVDVLNHPYVFGIDGWDPIRIHKGTGSVCGISVEQLELIVRTVKDANGTDNGDAKQVKSRKAGTTSSRGSTAPANDGFESRKGRRVQGKHNASNDESE